jgi:H+/Cl- antiporter ClcA
MNKTVFHLFILIGAVFSLLAASIAYLVTYKEEEHHYSNKKEAIKRALQMAIFTFIFFFVLMLVIGYYI